MRGSEGGIIYKGKGSFHIEGEDYHFDKVSWPLSRLRILSDEPQVNLVAGGTGLTPHWQFIHAVLSDPEDSTKISMIDRYVVPDVVEDPWFEDSLQ